jgi:hypothetical protein
MYGKQKKKVLDIMATTITATTIETTKKQPKRCIESILHAEILAISLNLPADSNRSQSSKHLFN